MPPPSGQLECSRVGWDGRLGAENFGSLPARQWPFWREEASQLTGQEFRTSGLHAVSYAAIRCSGSRSSPRRSYLLRSDSFHSRQARMKGYSVSPVDIGGGFPSESPSPRSQPATERSLCASLKVRVRGRRSSYEASAWSFLALA